MNRFIILFSALYFLFSNYLLANPPTDDQIEKLISDVNYCSKLRKGIQKIIDMGMISNFKHWGLSLDSNYYKFIKEFPDDAPEDPAKELQEWKAEWASKRKELDINKDKLADRVKKLKEFDAFEDPSLHLYQNRKDLNYYFVRKPELFNTKSPYEKIKTMANTCLEDGQKIIDNFQDYLGFARMKMNEIVNTKAFEEYRENINDKFMEAINEAKRRE